MLHEPDLAFMSQLDSVCQVIAPKQNAAALHRALTQAFGQDYFLKLQASTAFGSPVAAVKPGRGRRSTGFQWSAGKAREQLEAARFTLLDGFDAPLATFKKLLDAGKLEAPAFFNVDAILEAGRCGRLKLRDNSYKYFAPITAVRFHRGMVQFAEISINDAKYENDALKAESIFWYCYILDDKGSVKGADLRGGYGSAEKAASDAIKELRGLELVV